jgi:hypothetical protein
MSTGPLTPRGKARSAQNALRHGLRSDRPVVASAGETAPAWRSHRAGVLESLAPQGYLETLLAERCALLLWRLHRVARYEAKQIDEGTRSAERRAVASAVIGLGESSPLAPRTLECLREEAELSAEDGPAVRRLLAALEEPGAAPAFDADTVGRVFFAAERAVRGLQLPDAEEREEWALSDVVEALEDARGQPAAALLQQVAEAAYRRHLRLLIAVRQAEEDTASGKALALLPTESDLQKIARYESHLHRLLTSTLHELEALQARRRGEPAPLARLDVAGLPPGE